MHKQGLLYLYNMCVKLPEHGLAECSYAAIQLGVTRRKYASLRILGCSIEGLASLRFVQEP